MKMNMQKPKQNTLATAVEARYFILLWLVGMVTVRMKDFPRSSAVMSEAQNWSL